jgi:tetratricopeptide (TPR) repeat protein
MSRDKLQLLSPLFLKYQSEYEKNPRSRVFAPLAETYRKLGMTDKAMEILAQGIRFHPTYVMGYLGLAFCYFDIKQYNLSYSTLRPLVESNRDNIRLQKLFADICLQLNHKEEALETYKYLLFINPRDKEIAAQVTMLENLLESQYRPTHKPIYIPEEELKSDYKSSPTFDVEKLQEKPKSDALDFDDWLALDLSKETKTPEKTEDQYDFWNLNKGTTQLQTSPKEVIPQKQEERVFEVKLDFDKE